MVTVRELGSSASPFYCNLNCPALQDDKKIKTRILCISSASSVMLLDAKIC